MTATEPPPPPAVASYLGPDGPDIGVTDVITDPQGDFFDPYEGADAEAGLGVDAMDLRSIRYLGNMDGTGDAMFEAITFGDACALADDHEPAAAA